MGAMKNLLIDIEYAAELVGRADAVAGRTDRSDADLISTIRNSLPAFPDEVDAATVQALRRAWLRGTRSTQVDLDFVADRLCVALFMKARVEERDGAFWVVADDGFGRRAVAGPGYPDEQGRRLAALDTLVIAGDGEDCPPNAGDLPGGRSVEANVAWHLAGLVHGAG